MDAYGIKLIKGLPFAHKLANINVSRSAVMKRAFVPAIRYNCDENYRSK